MDAYDGKLLDLMKELGDILMFHDQEDIGRFSFEGHPSPIHHWQWGAILKYGSDGIRWLSALSEMQRFLGAPSDEIDRLQANFYAILNGP